MTIQMSNNLGLPPLGIEPSLRPISSQSSASSSAVTVADPLQNQSSTPSTLQVEFPFELPIGALDTAGQLHRYGVMRLARTVDEIAPMSDPRVQANPAYATVIILARVILSLGDLQDISPITIESLFAGDLNYLQNFYREINGLTGYAS
jgi:hypothetical protein